MSNDSDLNSDGDFKGYPDILATLKRKAKECPKGVSLKLQGKYLMLQFVHPGTGKRLPKSCNVTFTEDGIIQAVAKAWKVKDALGRFATSSEFWTWYDIEILGVNSITNDLKTYREIFEEIENEYWSGNHKNTKEKRDHNCPNFEKSFYTCKGKVFDKFPNWDKYPEWDDFKNVLFSWVKGSKTFKDVYFVLQEIINHCPKTVGLSLMEKLGDIDYQQTIFKEKQSISCEEFLSWHKNAQDDIQNLVRQCDRDSRRQWLWVSAMCMIYGLRPGEIMSAINLEKPVTEKDIKDSWGVKGKRLGNSKVTIKAINDPTNTELLLVLGNQYYIGNNNDIPITIKTGGRICPPLCNSKKIIELLKIQQPYLPKYIPDPDSDPKTLPGGISKKFGVKLKSYNCPVNQAYAFRHLGNQLGEKYGIPQETRARSLGHSVAVNDSTYKSRSNLQTTIDLLTNYSKQPLGLDAAKFQLESIGFDLDDPSVIAILKVIYQLE